MKMTRFAIVVLVLVGIAIAARLAGAAQNLKPIAVQPTAYAGTH